jgi:PKD repeat protein
VTLTVTDDDGATGQHSQTVNLGSNPALITAAFTTSCTGLTCQFTNNSSHRDGVNLLANWDMGDGSDMRLEWSPTHTYAQAGTYVVIMVVLAEDFSGWSSKRDTITVSVEPPPPPPTGPTAAFTYTCSYLSCTFTDESTAGSAAITTRSWSFGDGTANSSEANPQHTFATGGTYAVTLTVTDGNGLPDTETSSVAVQAPAAISLTLLGYKVKGKYTVDLTWSGATTSRVAIMLNGSVLTDRPNSITGTNTWTHRTGKSRLSTWIYRVCEATQSGEPTSVCSAPVEAVF